MKSIDSAIQEFIKLDQLVKKVILSFNCLILNFSNLIYHKNENSPQELHK